MDLRFANYSDPPEPVNIEVVVGPDPHVRNMWIVIAPPTPQYAIRSDLEILTRPYYSNKGGLTTVCALLWYDRRYMVFGLSDGDLLASPVNWSWIDWEERCCWRNELPKLADIFFPVISRFNTSLRVEYPFAVRLDIPIALE